MNREPWFEDRGIGTLFLRPVSPHGWAALLLYIILLLCSVVLPRGAAAPYCIILTVGYLALSYLKSRRV